MMSKKSTKLIRKLAPCPSRGALVSGVELLSQGLKGQWSSLPCLQSMTIIVNLTCFYKSGCISFNPGPIFKIQNLAYSETGPHPSPPCARPQRQYASYDLFFIQEVMSSDVTQHRPFEE